VAVPDAAALEATMSPAATITPTDAAARLWDVVVIGAGPAGAAAAVDCARRGLSTLLVDKSSFPRWKVCGCCLNERAVAWLGSLGVLDAVQRAGAVRLSRLRVGVGPRSVDLPVFGGMAVSREALDAAMVSAAIAAGADFLPHAAAEGTTLASQYRAVQVRSDEQVVNLRGRLVLAADGLHGTLMAAAGTGGTVKPGSRVGAGAVLPAGGPAFEPGCVHMAVAAGGYVGAVRIEEGRTALAAALDAGFVKRCGGLARAAGEVLRSARFPGADEAASLPWRGTPALTRQGAVGAERLLALGDAASYVEPFTGEGMAWALTCGASVADLARAATRTWQPAILHEWAARHRRLVGRRQRVCRAVSVLLRHPTVCGLAVRALRLWPGAIGPLVRSVGRPALPQRTEPA
jgi:flavin-dependent dehydrogenase